MGSRNRKFVPRKAAATFDETDMRNEKMETYYKTQGILSEEEWPVFWETLKQPLPSSFRINKKESSAHLQKQIQEEFVPMLSNVTFEGKLCKPPQQLAWFPEGLAWQLEQTKLQIRKSPEFAHFQRFLVYETETGNITRQEAVSMIPPLLLAVKPHHLVIDMCAAPGSKTTQMMEDMHTNGIDEKTNGLLIANDSDGKRAYMLIHQASRLPTINVMFTNHDATRFPNMMLHGKPMLFDRILCDVPCSGDGTIRKNVTVWRDWNKCGGNGLHSLQLRILTRAIAMLKPGGRIVYSTCSMNPIENEAVIASAIKQHPSMSIVDSSEILSKLEKRPGLKTWRVFSDKETMNHYGSHEEFETYIEQLDLPARKKFEKIDKAPSTMYPPSKEDADAMNLERCVRVYPHQQNTGGFFITLLEKKVEDSPTEASSEIPEMPFADDSIVDSSEITSHGQKRSASASPEREVTVKKIKKPQPVSANNNNPFKEDPYTYVAVDDPDLISAIKHFGFNDKFNKSNLLVRNATGEISRAVFLTSNLVHDVLNENNWARIRLLSCGAKIIERQSIGANSAALQKFDCKLRIVNEGLEVMLPFMKPERIWHANAGDLRVVLANYFPLFTDLDESSDLLANLKNSEIPPGSHIAEFKLPESDKLVHLPIWKTNMSVSLMISKAEKSLLSKKIYHGEDITEAMRKQLEDKIAKPAVINHRDAQEVDGDASVVQALREEASVEAESGPNGLEDLKQSEQIV